MSNIELTLIIVGMFGVTYGIRTVLFVGASRSDMPDWLDRALKFVPVSVLTAIIAPMVLTREGDLAITLSNPWLVGALVSLGVGMLLKRQLLTICVGVTVFFVMKIMTAN